MKIIYLYSEMMSYTACVIRNLADLGHEVHIVERDKIKKKNLVDSKDYKNKIFFYKRIRFNLSKLKNLIKKVNPKIIVVSGWMDFLYLYLLFFLQTNSLIIVFHSDNVWKNSAKQQIARFLGFFKFFYLFFNKAWIHGPLQFEYVRKIGYKTKDIIFDHASADTGLFHNLYKKNFYFKKKRYPKKFIFVGRREKIKGIEILLDAWEFINKEKKNKNWKLQIIGSGNLVLNKSNLDNLEILPFKSHQDLKKEIKNSGCFILPSIDEPWGVVVHEMCAAGLPLILSESVGSRYAFLINKTNGFVFEKNSSRSLAEAMLNIIKLNDEELLEMSKKSYQLSFRISPEFASASLLSVVD